MRDDFNQPVKEEVAKRVSFCCSCPDCGAPTSGPQSEEGTVNVGVAAHITAASEGGPRYDASLTSTQRASTENCIWLCQNHAKLIDNDVTKYTVDLLRTWKAQAETKAAKNVGKAKANSDIVNDPDFFQKVVDAYKKKGTPKYFLDSQNLTNEQRADLYDRSIQSEKGRSPKNNPYTDA